MKKNEFGRLGLRRLDRLGLKSTFGSGGDVSTFLADFAGNEYRKDRAPAVLADVFALTRASTKWADNVAGTWAEFAINVAARTDKGMALGSADVTNYALGADFAGAVAGTPGTMPTKMPMSALPSGLTKTISLVTVNGLPALRLAISGTPGSTLASFIDIVGNGDGPAIGVAGERWEAGIQLAATVNSGALPALAININERTAANANNGAGTNTAVTGLDATLRYKSNFRVITNGGGATTKTTSSLSISFTSGVAVDFVLDLVAPSHVKGSPATPIPIITTGTAKTQSADAASLLLPATPIDFMLTFASGAYRVAFNKSGTYALGASDLPGTVPFTTLKKAQDLRRRAPPIYDNFAVQADGDLPGRVAKSGQVWQNLVGSSGAGVNGVIAGGSLISKVDSSPPSTLCYNALRHSRDITSLYAEIGFGPSSGAALATLIICPVRGTAPEVLDIVKGSIHIQFYKDKSFVQYFNPAAWDANTNPGGSPVELLAHTYAAPLADFTKKLAGFRLVGTTLFVLMPDGVEWPIVNAIWPSLIGSCMIIESSFENADGGDRVQFGNVYAGDDAFLAAA